MKIAMVDPSLFTGRYDDSLCAALGALGHDVTLWGRPLRDTDAIEPAAYRYRPRFFRMGEALRPLIGEGASFRAVKAAEYMVDAMAGPIGDRVTADVVHYQWLPFAPADRHALRRLRRRVPLVHTVHNASAYHGDSGVQGRGYAGLLEQFDRLIVHGETTHAALIEAGVAAARIALVPHPPMRLAQADPAAMAAVADPVLPRLLFFGTIRPYKGLDVLIDACLSLWRAGSRFELAIAGKPFIDIAPLIARVAEADFTPMLVTDLGFLKEERLDAHLRKADIVVFPYRHIDSSGAFLSALHYGKAMVCSDTGLFGALPRDPVSGAPATLVPPDNAVALADALLPLIRSAAIRQAAGLRAWTLGTQLGDWKDAALLTMDAYGVAQAMAAARGIASR